MYTIARVSGQVACVRSIAQMAQHFRKNPVLLQEEEVANYLVYLKTVKKFAPSSMRIVHAALKFFYGYACPRPWQLLTMIRSERQRTLPDVLSIEEVQAIVGHCRTLHHQTYLWTVYSCGLRLDEALCLKVADIDSRRMMVHVHRGKGAQDRYVPLPQSTLEMLRAYWVTHRNRARDTNGGCRNDVTRSPHDPSFPGFRGTASGRETRWPPRRP